MAVFQRDEIWICRHRVSLDSPKQQEERFGRGEAAYEAAVARDAEWKEYFRQLREYNAYQAAQAEAVNPNAITFGQLVYEFLRHITVGQRSANHITSIRTVAEAILIPQIGADTNIAEIDYAKHLLPLKEALQTKPTPKGKMLTPTTINKYAHFLKSIFNYAIKRGYLDRNPMALWDLLRVKKETRQLTKEDIAHIMEHASPHVRWAMEVAYNLGVRTGKSELLSLKWCDVDFENHVVHVYGRKTNTHRDVFISPEFCQRLAEVKAESTCEYIVSYKGKQVHDLHKGFSNACKAAGITYPVRMYDIRHRYASELIMANAPIPAVSKTLGHSRISTTLDAYCECLPSDCVKLPTMLPPLPTSMQQDNIVLPLASNG